MTVSGSATQGCLDRRLKQSVGFHGTALHFLYSVSAFNKNFRHQTSEFCSSWFFQFTRNSVIIKSLPWSHSHVSLNEAKLYWRAFSFQYFTKACLCTHSTFKWVLKLMTLKTALHRQTLWLETDWLNKSLTYNYWFHFQVFLYNAEWLFICHQQFISRRWSKHEFFCLCFFFLQFLQVQMSHMSLMCCGSSVLPDVSGSPAASGMTAWRGFRSAVSPWHHIIEVSADSHSTPMTTVTAGLTVSRASSSCQLCYCGLCWIKYHGIKWI